MFFKHICSNMQKNYSEVAFSDTQGRTWGWFLSQMYSVIDHCCPKSTWSVTELVYRQQEEQPSSSAMAGRIVPFSMLAVHLFQLLIFLPDLNHLKWKFPCLISEAALFRKTKWFSCFRGWVRENMCCFAHTENSVDPPLLAPSLLLCYVVLFCFL